MANSCIKKVYFKCNISTTEKRTFFSTKAQHQLQQTKTFAAPHKGEAPQQGTMAHIIAVNNNEAGRVNANVLPSNVPLYIMLNGKMIPLTVAQVDSKHQERQNRGFLCNNNNVAFVAEQRFLV